MTDHQSTTCGGQTGRRALINQTAEIEALPRYERKKIRTRERIYRAALKLFAERGLAATTVDQITEEADVGKGTFFNYFCCKEEVFAFFIETQLGKVVEAVAEAKPGERPIREVMHRAFQRLAEELGASPRLAQGLISAIVGNDAARETVATGMAEGRRLLSAILRLGQRRAQVRKDRSVHTMSLAFQQALFGTLLLWAISPERKLESVLDSTFEDYWTCVVARNAKNSQPDKE